MSHDSKENAPLLSEPAAGRAPHAAFLVPREQSPEEFDTQLQLRRVDFDLWSYYRSAWQFYAPNAWRFVGVELLVIVLFVAIGIISSIFGHFLLRGVNEEKDPFNLWAMVYHFFFDFLPGPLVMDPIHASAFVAVFRALRHNRLVELGDFFDTFSSPYYFSLLVLIFLRMFMTVALFLLLVVPGIWFLICVVFAYPLHYEHSHLGAWGAIKASITVVMHYFCPMFFFELSLLLLQLAGALCFGVGVLFTLPFALCALCYCYHHLIGIKGMAVLHVPSSAASASASSSSHHRSSASQTEQSALATAPPSAPGSGYGSTANV